MRIPAALLLLSGLPVFGLIAAEPVVCLETVGSISFPPWDWGYAYGGSTEAAVAVEANGSARILNLDEQTSDWSSSFQLEVQKSIASSVFDRSCAGQAIHLSYRFEVQGEKSKARDVSIAKTPPNNVVITAHPPEFLCAAAAANDDDAESMRGQADRLVDDRLFPEALQCVAASIQWKPLADAYITQGVALRKLNRLAAAIAAYDQAEKLDPANRHVYFDRANSYRDLGQLDRAIQDYTAAISNNPRHNLSYVNRGNVYLRLQRFDLALLDYSIAVELNPKDSNAHSNRGLILSHLGDHQLALEEYQKTILLRPIDPTAYSNRAGTWIALQKYEEAIRDATIAIRFDPHYFEAYFHRGVAYAMSRQFDAAAADLSEAIRIRPESAAYALRALARKELGDAEGAKADQEQATKLGKTWPTMWFTRDPLTGASIPLR